MKNNKKIDDKTVEEINSFINEEIWASRIWVFSGIVISILLCMMLKNYMIFELDNIIQPLRKLKLPDIKGIFLTILFILEVLLLFTLPKILINRQKKNMHSGGSNILIPATVMPGLMVVSSPRKTKASQRKSGLNTGICTRYSFSRLSMRRIRHTAISIPPSVFDMPGDELA